MHQPSATLEQTRAKPGFVTVAAILVLLLACASAPSPLYGLYAQDWRFSPTVLTIVFAVYALALLATLLTVGSLSDQLGRRPVILAGLALQAVSLIGFLSATGLWWLLAARVVQGISTGLVTSAVAAALIDRQPPARPYLGSLTNAVAPTVGLAAGAVGSGALVQYGPAPLRTVYVLLLVLTAISAAAFARIPEPRPRPAARLELRPHLGLEPSVRPLYWAALPCLVATWALGGLLLSLGPSLFLHVADSTNRLGGGLFIAALCLPGAAASLLARTSAPDRAMLVGCLLLAAGLAAAIPAIAATSAPWLVVATIVAGAGFGTAFFGAFRFLAARASTERRGALVAAIYIAAYLAFSLPAVAAGILATHLGLDHTAIGYAAVVAVLALVAALLRAFGVGVRTIHDEPEPTGSELSR